MQVFVSLRHADLTGARPRGAGAVLRVAGRWSLATGTVLLPRDLLRSALPAP